MNVTPKSPFSPPTCNTEAQLFYRYFYFVWQPALEKAWNDVFIEPMSGCIRISITSEGKELDLYATPMWEEEINSIPWSITDENDDHLESGSIPFPLDGWTMDVDKDVERYIFTMKLWIQTTLPSVLWKMFHSNRKKNS